MTSVFEQRAVLKKKINALAITSKPAERSKGSNNYIWFWGSTYQWCFWFFLLLFFFAFFYFFCDLSFGLSDKLPEGFAVSDAGDKGVLQNRHTMEWYRNADLFSLESYTRHFLHNACICPFSFFTKWVDTFLWYMSYVFYVTLILHATLITIV